MVTEEKKSNPDQQNHGATHGDIHDHGGDDPVIGIVPVGGAVWWWGVLDELPENWVLVDGTHKVNGSTPPDMRDKMPIGAGTTYALGDTGGSATLADHSDHSDHPDHGRHEAAGGHEHDNHTASLAHTGTHLHGQDTTLAAAGTDFLAVNNVEAAAADSDNHVINEAHDTRGEHDHDDHSEHGSHSSHSSHGTNLPPYAAWYFIQRIS